MPQAKINIVGQIGRAENEPVQGTVTLLEIVPQVRTAIEGGADELLFAILSPGGYVDEGNAIYNYIMSLKSDKLKVNTTTLPDPVTGKSLVGSIATKIYLAGTEREVAVGDDFFIHNPWMNPGPSDSKALFDSAEAALKAEEELKAFYCAVTKNTPEALAPFMDAETSFTGDQAVKFGFATKLKNKVALVAKVKSMNTKTSSLKELFASAVDALTGKKPAVKAIITNKSGKLKADINVTDAAGVGYFIDDDNITDLSQITASPTPVPIFLANPDGTPSTTPAPDGDITTSDGWVISVSGGVISNVKQSTDMENKALAAKVEALETGMAEMKNGIAQLVEALKGQSGAGMSADMVKTEISNAVLALKKEIGSTHTPQRTKAEKNLSIKNQLEKMGPIALKQKYGTTNLDEIEKKLGV